MKNRVTTEDLDAAIVKTDFEVLKDGRTTVCTLTLDNGFTVQGTSACVDPNNFSKEEGERWALAKARDNVWQFLGMRLADKLQRERNLASESMGFGAAIECLRDGLAVARAGWNGRGQFLQLQVPDEHSKMTLPYIYITTVQGDRVPWLASQSDMLANDWTVVFADGAAEQFPLIQN